jgi:formylglycine-generating enzyme required for sulfatase activity
VKTINRLFKRQYYFELILFFLGLLILPSCKNIEQDFGMKFVSIPGGSFDMGCSPGDVWCEFDEIPAHTITLSPFKISAYETTCAQWNAVMCNNQNNPTFCQDCQDCQDCPVVNVSWNDVQLFIKKIRQITFKKYRLPSEAEWEYAARAGTTTRYYCGDDEDCIKDIAWYADNSNYIAHPVGQREPNAFGLYDMLGNVYEWCNDWYNQGYYDASPEANPKGPASATTRVKRGGGIGSSAGRVRATYRYGSPPDFSNVRLGFRLCIDK